LNNAGVARFHPDVRIAGVHAFWINFLHKKLTLSPRFVSSLHNCYPPTTATLPLSEVSAEYGGYRDDIVEEIRKHVRARVRHRQSQLGDFSGLEEIKPLDDLTNRVKTH